MKRAVFGILAWFGVVAVVATPTSSAISTFRSVSNIYDLYLGGILAGELTMDADVAGERYSAQSIMRTAGVVGFFYKASYEAETEGALTAQGMFPDRFSAASRMKSKEQYVEMIYGGGAPQTVNAEPAFIPKPWEIDPAEQTGTMVLMPPIQAPSATPTRCPFSSVISRPESRIASTVAPTQ